MKFHPGTHWNYGLSTDIVGRLVEILSGLPFDEYLRREIFDPLGMPDTGFFVPEPDHPRLTALYQYRPANSPTRMEGSFAEGYVRPRSYLSGAGGLVSTTADYVAFCQMLANGGHLGGKRILGRKTLELMTVNHLPEARRFRTSQWAVSVRPASRVWGSAWGSRSAWGRLPLPGRVGR